MVVLSGINISHNRRIGMYSCSPLEYTKACARATARCAYSDVSLIWSGSSPNVELPCNKINGLCVVAVLVATNACQQNQIITYHPQSGWFEDTPLKGGTEEGYPLKGGLRVHSS
jgi:hypothetical protein